MERTFRAVIAEDHAILRAGLRALLEAKLAGCEIVDEAGDGLGAIRAVEKHKPDLLFLDLSMPKMDGLSAIKDIRRSCPAIKILVLTVHKDEEYILDAFRSGADGYCVKDADCEELLTAIQCVLSGKTYVCPEIAGKVLEGYLEGKKTLKETSPLETLTAREQQILKLIGEGQRSKDIADFLCISPKTVNKHRANIMTKLGIHRAAGLAACAIKQGLTSK
jgi:two-component system, NarL family, response regulator NreC